MRMLSLLEQSPRVQKLTICYVSSHNRSISELTLPEWNLFPESWSDQKFRSTKSSLCKMLIYRCDQDFKKEKKLGNISRKAKSLDRTLSCSRYFFLVWESVLVVRYFPLCSTMYWAALDLLKSHLDHYTFPVSKLATPLKQKESKCSGVFSRGVMVSKLSLFESSS